MPRKTPKPRKQAGKRPVTAPRTSRRRVSPTQTRLRSGLDRHHRVETRLPKLPGRQGGR